jgi:hypothetical protein
MFSMAHLLDTTLGFILPSVSTAFLIFFFRQSSMSFPMEIVQAARVDGLNEFGIYARFYYWIHGQLWHPYAVGNDLYPANGNFIFYPAETLCGGYLRFGKVMYTAA